MRVLVVPMSAMAETAGSFSRVLLLTDALKEADIDTAVCLARDVNYRPIDGVKSYFLSVPMPLGLPKMIAAHTFPIAQKLGITSRKSVNSFDDVLHLTGNTDYKYLKQSVSDIRNAIQDFNPDVIYSEFNISAIVAGKIEKKKIFIPASNEPNGHACMPRLATAARLLSAGGACLATTEAKRRTNTPQLKLRIQAAYPVSCCGVSDFLTGY